MARSEEEKRAAQAAAHKRWYLSAKGQAYRLKLKMKGKDGVSEGQQAGQEVQANGTEAPQEAESK